MQKGEHMPEIMNYNVYNDRMRRSMWDKAFFMDKVPDAQAVVDYGCADGSLVRFLHGLFPAMRFIGFDIDPAMIAAANARREENTWFSSDIKAVPAKLREMNIPGCRTAVNFSSVFHEIFHYGFNLSEIKAMIASVNPQYLVVRDMMYDSMNDEMLISREMEARVRESLPAWQIADFEKAYGSIRLRRNLVHLMLKYKYTENWARECEENYFSFIMEDLMKVLNEDHGYRPLLFSRYILPWVRYDIENRLGIDLGDEFTTHFTLVLGKRKNAALSLNEGESINDRISF